MTDALLYQHSVINNRAYATDALFSVNTPFDDTELTTVSAVDNKGIEEAILSAEAAFTELSTMTAEKRSQLLMAWYDKVMANQEALAKLLTKEQGKAIKEARAEVAYGAGFIKLYAEEATRCHGKVLVSNNPAHRIETQYQGVGVVAGITPWNFPVAMITRKVAPAIAAGCSFILKPSELTPLCAIALAHLAVQAGFPKGAFNVLVSDDAKAVGKVLTQDARIRKFTFTGSTQVGSTLLAQCASTIKRTSMELGGNAPFIIFESANLTKAVAGLMAGKFRNAGQTCVAINRVLVAKSRLDELLELLIPKVQALTLGNGLDDSTDIGPLISVKAKEKVTQLVDDALQKGAKVQYQGDELGGQFMAPMVLTGITPEMEIYHQEVFGPIVAISTFDDESEALTAANQVPYGLASYFYSESLSQIMRVSQALDYGMVGINEGVISNPIAPFGGVKQSGLGREGSAAGLYEYLEEKYLCFNIE